ncbi:MAG TPA: hypothetical protein PLP27_06450 [Crocinitomicaceae bacterium]|nr:hypothetical protein [Crocinitomicaceae bacterium]
MNFAQYFAIEKRLRGQGLDLDRSEVVSRFTDGKKNSLTALTPHEYRELINWLNKTFAVVSSTPNQIDKLQLQRRKIIAMLCKIGYIDQNGKPDMLRIYAWVEIHGYKHIHLNRYTEQDIPKLVTQAEKFYKSHIERL